MQGGRTGPRTSHYGLSVMADQNNETPFKLSAVPITLAPKSLHLAGVVDGEKIARRAVRLIDASHANIDSLRDTEAVVGYLKVQYV